MATITATKNGSWNDATTWDLARVPAVGDTIALAGHSVAFDIDLPAVENVLDTDTVNGAAGTYRAPDADEVGYGIHYGPASALVGTYSMPIVAGGGVTVQEHVDAILAEYVFAGELYYIQHPDPTGAEVAQTYGVWSIVGGKSLQTLEGDTGAGLPRIQISVYSTSSADLIAKVAAVNAAMLAAATLAQTSDPDTTPTALFNYSSSVPVDGFEEETHRYYSHMDFYIGVT